MATPTADPSELTRLAQQCRSEADALDNAVRNLNSKLSPIHEKWTGIAADSFMLLITEKTQAATQAASWLRDAASHLERGAGQIRDFRDQEAAREKREEERRKQQSGRR
jgi:WXG100 family type VII secretion target